jgi:GDPmannose 4,6-dehydratase
MLQQDKPDDYVLATNETHTVREFVQNAFAHADLDWKQYIKHDDRYERPAEVDLLLGDPSKAKKQLGWQPKVRFQELVKIMVDADLECVRREIEGSGEGRKKTGQ